MALNQRWLPPVGEQVAEHYLLNEFVGYGPTGAVYQATDQRSGAAVSVKAIHPKLFTGRHQQTNETRLRQAAKRKNDGLVNTLDVVLPENDQSPAICVTEVAPGLDLRSLMQLRRNSDSRLSHAEVHYILYGIGQVLRWMHEGGCHSNLKPENVFITESGVRLCDPYMLAGRSRLQWMVGEFPLRDHYLAAEQLMRGAEETAQCDIFALGMILGELVAGEAVRFGIPLSDQAEDIPPLLDGVFLKATANEPIDRHVGIDSFLGELERALPTRASGVEFDDPDTQIAELEDVLSPQQLAELADHNRALQAERAARRKANRAEELPFGIEVTPGASTSPSPTPPSDSLMADEDELDRTVIEDSDAIAEMMERAARDEAWRSTASHNQSGDSVIELGESDLAEMDEDPSEIPGIPSSAAHIIPHTPERPRERRGQPADAPPTPVALEPEIEDAIELAEELPPTPAEELQEDLVPALPEEVLEEEEALILADDEEDPIAIAPARKVLSSPGRKGAPTSVLPPPSNASRRAALSADADEAPTIDASAAEVLSQAPSRAHIPQPSGRARRAPKGARPAKPTARIGGSRKQTDDESGLAPKIAIACTLLFSLVLIAYFATRPGDTPQTDKKSPINAVAVAQEDGKKSAKKASEPSSQAAPETGDSETKSPKATEGDKAKDDQSKEAAESPKGEDSAKEPAADEKKEEKAKDDKEVSAEALAAAKAKKAQLEAQKQAEKEKTSAEKAAKKAQLAAEKEAKKAELAAKKQAKKEKKAAAAAAKKEEKATKKAELAAKKQAAKQKQAELAATKKAKKAELAAKKQAAKQKKAELAAAKKAKKAELAAAKKAKKAELAATKKSKAEATRMAKEQAWARKQAEKDAKEMQVASVTPKAGPVDERKSCPKGMKLITRKEKKTIAGRKVVLKTAFCVDYHEYPGRGSKPKTNVSWYDASQLCEARGKRLCARKEWRRACGSKDYPYGEVYDPGLCNTASESGQGRPLKRAGSMKKCRSPYGISDMSGNVSEWLADKKVAGGNAQQDGEGATCGRAAKRLPSTKSSYVGFRCCADPY